MTEPIHIQVWPGAAPGETTLEAGHALEDRSGDVTRITGVTSPQLFVYPLDGVANAPTVLVCPGGGYTILAADLEGTEVARWLNSLGFAAAVLHYRVPDNRAGALQDGQRALSLLRAQSSEFGIDPKRVGVLGFSAGGHLAAKLAVCGAQRNYTPVDVVDEQSCRPDFAMPIYPAYLINRDTGLPEPDVQPIAGMPPLFLAQTSDDSHFCTPAYADALRKANVPCESHVYERGGHGYGLRAAPDVPASQWPADAARWLTERCGEQKGL